MAASTGKDGKAVCGSDVDLLLHPELLSEEFMKLILNEKRVSTGGCEGRDRLMELYLRHVIPLPQRTLPRSRWGRRMEQRRRRDTPAGLSSDIDRNRKRPLIVFDGSSFNSGPVKVKKSESPVVASSDRLKPPPSSNPPANTVRRLPAHTQSSSAAHHANDTTDLKREANDSSSMSSSEGKKRIQHVTWP